MSTLTVAPVRAPRPTGAPSTVAEQPVVEVVAHLTHVVVVCHHCPDDRRLPVDDLALKVGVAAFLDEHADCGPVRIRLPLDQPAATAPEPAVL